jgi:hypothetical protein
MFDRSRPEYRAENPGRVIVVVHEIDEVSEHQ